MTEVEICGGGHRTRVRNQLVCYGVSPAPEYKGAREEEAGPRRRARQGESYSHREYDSFFPSPTRRRGERREVEKEGRGGPRPKPFVQFGLGLGGARATSWLLPTKAH